MSLVDSLKPMVSSIRSIPGQLGLRPHTVSVVLDAWSGAELGEGALTRTITSIAEQNGYPPKTRNLSSEEIAVAGYDRETWEIGPITPSFIGGGTLLATLSNSNLAANTEPHFVITGPSFPNGANFRVVRSSTDKALHYTFQVQRVADGGALPTSFIQINTLNDAVQVNTTTGAVQV